MEKYFWGHLNFYVNCWSILNYAYIFFFQELMYLEFWNAKHTQLFFWDLPALTLPQSMSTAWNVRLSLSHVYFQLIHVFCAKFTLRGGTAVSSSPRGFYFVLLYILFLFSFFSIKKIIYINFLKGLYVMWWVYNKYLI